MALFLKQEFLPPIFSKKWILFKFRPNMIIHSREHITSILESGLLFREDSLEVEQEFSCSQDIWNAAGGCNDGWFTKGERIAAALTLAACITALPPRNASKWTAVKIVSWLAAPAVVRWQLRRLGRTGSLTLLLSHMRCYLALARRAAACVKEYAAVHNRTGSVMSTVEATRELLCRQQSSLAVTLSRASSALLGNLPWLKGDLAWEAVEKGKYGQESLTKIHHAFLVVQSTFLKHVATSHFPLSPQQQKMYKNHNERIHWLHTVLIEHINDEFKESLEVLERSYRLLKNYGSNDKNMKKFGHAVNNSWLYSDVQSGIARASLELKLCLEKSTDLDMFLDSCATDNRAVELEILSKDVDDIIEAVTKCLATLQAAQIRLNKMSTKQINSDDKTIAIDVERVDENIVIIEDKEPEIRDEVFYFVRTEDDEVTQPVRDLPGPGKKEKELNKIVLNELKRKLVKREDVMRERERQALRKTMPEVACVEFPRQISVVEYVTPTGYMNKVKMCSNKKRLFRHYKIKPQSYCKKIFFKKCKLIVKKFVDEKDIMPVPFTTTASLKQNAVSLLSFSLENDKSVITIWKKCFVSDDKPKEKAEDSKNVNSNDYNSITNNNGPEEENFKVSKEELELSTSSDSDFDDFKENNKVSLLNDIRKHRVASNKNYPIKKASKTLNSLVLDEQMRPIEYKFGTGMTIASVLQVNSQSNGPRMVEDVFIGNGEVSEDSGNDED